MADGVEVVDEVALGVPGCVEQRAVEAGQLDAVTGLGQRRRGHGAAYHEPGGPEPPEALVQPDPRRPAERGAGLPLVEPVRGGQLLGEEPGHGRGRAATGSRRRRPRRGRAGRARPTGAPGRRPRRRSTPAARQRAAAPAGDDEHAAVQAGSPVEGGDERVDGVVDVGGVDQRRSGADDREPPGPGAGDDPADELRVAGPPHQVRPHDDHRRTPRVLRLSFCARESSFVHASSCVCAREFCVRVQHRLLRQRLAAGVVAAGAGRIGRAGTPPDERVAGVRHRRRRHVHEPRDPRVAGGSEQPPGPVDVRPRVLPPRPDHVDLRGEVHHGVLPGQRRGQGCGGVAEVGAHLADGQPGDAPLQHGHLVAARGERPRDGPAEHPAGPGDEHPHGARRRAARPSVAGGRSRATAPGSSHPTGRAHRRRVGGGACGCVGGLRCARAGRARCTSGPGRARRVPPARPASAHLATRVRSIFAACRMSTGRASATSTAATGTPAPARTASVSGATASSGAPGRRAASPARARPRPPPAASRRPHSHGRRRRDPVHRLGPLLDPDRGHRPVRGGDHVHQPALHPQPALGVEVPDVAGAVPPRLARAASLDRPQLVVAVLDVRRRHADLAGHAGLAGQRRARPRERDHGDVHPGQRPPDAHPVPGAGRVDLGRARRR